MMNHFSVCYVHLNLQQMINVLYLKLHNSFKLNLASFKISFTFFNQESKVQDVYF